MNSLSKFHRSWLLLKSSVSVIGRHKKLLVFPIFTFFFTSLILLFFVTPIALQKTGYSYNQVEHWQAVGQTIFTEKSPDAPARGRHSDNLQIKPLGLAYAAGIYLVAMYLATFFNVAFYHEILKALRNEPVSVGAGMAFACGKWRPILMWTLLAGAVGLIIRTLEEKLPMVGQWVVGLLGLAWSVAAVFVIPIIITSEATANPLTMLKRSALTLKKTWGESLIGYLGLQVGNMLVLLMSVGWFISAVAVSIWLNNYWLLAVAGLLWLVAVVVFAYIMGVASQVYRCALFVYASEGTIPDPYNLEMLQMAWKVKKSKAVA